MTLTFIGLAFLLGVFIGYRIEAIRYQAFLKEMKNESQNSR